MAGRPIKVGLDYFELDCHMEEKVRMIQAEYGLKGFAVVVKLYQKIYGELGYYCEWNEDSLLLFMSENGVSSRDGKNLIGGIVSACIRRNIFSEQLFKKYGILTSKWVQERYLNATSRRDIVELKKEYLLISVPENSKNVVINSISDSRNSINDGRNPQSRVEESRVKKRNTSYSCPEPDKPPSEPPVISLILKDQSFYPICKSDIDQYAETYPAVDVMQEFRKMKSWCNDNEARRKTRRGIRRFINAWLSRAQDEGNRNSRAGNGMPGGFNDFQQRSYDYDELEKKLLKQSREVIK